MPEALEVLEAAVAALGGKPREGQQRMVSAVAEAFEGDKPLLVQAGTGTGKSLGYLAPTMLRAAQGHKAIISTATLALQRQILQKDAPAVVGALRKLGVRAPSVALLKGWNNYVCMYKASGGAVEETLFDSAEDEGPSRLGAQVMAVREWAQETDTGDRDDLDIPVTEKAWRQVSLSKRECVGDSCPFWGECFAVRAREQVADADVVITNHALLGIAATSNPAILPKADALVIDEAHQLPESVRSGAAVQISQASLRSVSRVLSRQGIDTEELDSTSRALMNAVRPLEGWIRDAAPDNVEAALRVTDTLACRAAAELKDRENNMQVQMARSAVGDLLEATGLAGDASPATVRWVARDRDGNTSLCAAPLEVAGQMASNLWEGHKVVLTSATLKVGDSFGSFAFDSGIAMGGDYDVLDVGSPFDYARQGIIYVAAHLPLPGRDGPSQQALAEAAALCCASKGGALLLYSSRAAADAAAEYLRENTDLRVLAQGQDSIAGLVREFAADGNACLVGTLSLWQGVDVPGSACRLVVIDKIPFPRPNDPITQARSEAATRAGRSAFATVSLPRAALLMAQGAGRLIRAASDRGMVAILDPRVRTKSYGRFLMAGLPPMWPTTNPEKALSALGRLAVNCS